MTPRVRVDDGDDEPEEVVSGDEALPGIVGPPTIKGFPKGYCYGVTRYADIILQGALPGRLADLIAALKKFRITLDELRAGGGGRTPFVARFDDSLKQRLEDRHPVWGKRNITIVKQLGFDEHVREVARVRGHEIDMFGLGGVGAEDHFPGVAVEMEWNNKNPFFDRDLNNFAALHREGTIAAGVIVTRGPRLQQSIGPVIRSKDGGLKYGGMGSASTHWNKLVPRVNLGGGGECPLLLVGIEPERIDGIEVVDAIRTELLSAEQDIRRARSEREAAEKRFRDARAKARRWQLHFRSQREAEVRLRSAEAEYAKARAAVPLAVAKERERKRLALDRLPPIGNDED